ncbi:MAG: cell division protein FtsA [Flavobacteriales bacterium]|nr:cell division protein FtsA [Flavobacteriales bacterium]
MNNHLQNINDIAVGLDIGTTKIVVIVGRKNEFGKLEILGVGRAKSLGVHRGVVNNIKLTIQSIQEAVQKAEKQSGIKIKNVTVGIAGQHIRSIHHSDYITRSNPEDMIDEKDIEKLKNQVNSLTMQPGEEIIHVLPQEYKVDSQNETTEPIGLCGTRLEANFHVVLGQVPHITNIGRCVKAAGLNLVGLVLEPIASSNSVLIDDEKEAGVALVDIGGGTTDIAIFKDNIIRHTAVIPFGGKIITEDIKIGCSIIEKQAEQLKVRFGSAIPEENSENEIVEIPSVNGREPKEISFKMLASIIQARLKEIINSINIELRSYGCDEQKKKLIAGIVLTGGGSNLKHIRQLMEYQTGIDVRIGNCESNFASKTPPELSNPEYATAVGLLMNGIDELHFTNPITEKENTEQEKVKIQSQNENKTKNEDNTIEKINHSTNKTNKLFSNFYNKIINYLNENE